MVSTQFGAILKELEPFFKCKLEPDQNDSCQIKMGIGITVQIEMDRSGYLLFGSKLGVLPLSRYRDLLVQQALKSNENCLPSEGTFGFSQKSNQLLIFLRLHPFSFSTRQMIELLPLFVTKAKKWSDAITKGEIPPVEERQAQTRQPSGIFGLIS